ncbi:uncharacterized protein LOC131029291 isoform X1 [Cryptomeria japonica]|uniref:uncharacterized protein LOC131029291 isoform X1 n=1 Tax=Cryptomeria japonica TaxID=3369 RepID=UPI0025ACC663|nr:uncharacterized protein LOC131029291 isoform X1 [Cryptomeria japonica]
MSRIIVSSNTWTVCMPTFTSTHLRARSSSTVFQNRFTHTFAKGNNDKVTLSLEARENPQLEDVNLVEKTNNEIKKPSKGGTMRGESKRFSTAAVKSGKSPKRPGPNKGSGPQHD